MTANGVAFAPGAYRPAPGRRIAAAAAVMFGLWASAQDPEAPTPAETAEAPAVEAGPEEAAAPAGEADDLASLSPRQRYNLGRERLSADDLDGAEAAFLSARDDAGADAELRYRAAFNLGMVLAARADGAAEEPERAIATLRDGAAWFADAVRGAPESDEDARVNLDILQRRIQQLADQLNKDRGLEARLERAIDDQRDLRDRIRRLLGNDAADAGADAFAGLAASARTLMADVAEVADLAGEERALLDALDDAERSPEQTVRAVQLRGLESHVQRARQSAGDARRRLRRLEGERGHRRADAALSELKRAYEQLLHPVTVLKTIASDELALAADTDALAALAGGAIRLDDDAAEAPEPPAWLNPEHLGQRQEDALVRTVEMLERFEAAAAPEAAAAEDPNAERLSAAAGEAVPELEAAVAAMRDANAALGRSEPRQALPRQVDAVAALGRAIERFAGIRELIELAHAGQSEAIGLLGEDDAITQERERLLRIADDNTDRLGRLDSLLEAELDAPAAAEPAPDAEQAEAARQRTELARELTAQALERLERFRNAVTGTGDALAAGTDVRDRLDELRRLYFTIVEHLRELALNQAETHDRAATAQFEEPDAPDAPSQADIAGRQSGHTATADTLAEALAEQADASTGQELPAGAGGGAEAAERLGQAAAEVRSAAGRMQSAATVFADDTPVREWEGALDDQVAAMDHLATAIALLQPPQSGDQEQDSQPQADDGEQNEDDEQMSRRQALKRLQAIRDREAERQRRRQASAPDPVEKDW